jgi:hypothetical protein
MKRKVKFQEGGAVPQTANEMSAEQRQRLRNVQLREMMERVRREGRRVGLAERARQRQTASDAARRAAAAERAAAQREVAELNQRREVQERNRRAPGANSQVSISRPPRRPSNFGPRATPPLDIPEPPRPSTVGATRGAIPSVGTAARMASRAVPGMNVVRGFMPTTLEPGAEFEREGLRQAREAQELDRMLAALPERPDEATEMRNALPVRPNIPVERRAARPAPAPAPRPRIREMTADELNDMELRRARAERQMEEDDARERRRREEEAARQMGGSGNIGSASARERGELEGHPGDFTYNNYKKGGMVKPKAAPKKMMKGGIVAKPKVAAKSKPKPKPMPFKKGGVIKKGRK